MKENLKIILNLYKKECITEEEASRLIEDIFDNKIVYYPYYNTLTYTLPFPKYEVTCKS